MMKYHPHSYLFLLFMKRAKGVKEVQGVLVPLSWADQDHNAFTGITFMLKQQRTNLRTHSIILHPLICYKQEEIKHAITFCSNINAFNFYDVNCLKKYF